MKNDSPELTLWLGSRIRYLRNVKKISQEKLAELSGLHRTYIGSCERGERNITIINLSVLCKNLDVTLKVFFDDY
jgi:transcriptional regulator with XRE-family HTH domain